MIRHATHLLTGQDREEAEHVAENMHELAAFLVDVLGTDDLGACWNGRVSWHDACHGLRDLGIRDQPRRLLSKVRGLEFIESSTCDRCCGFGGTFSVSMPGISIAMVDEKIEEMENLSIDAVASSDASCLMQLEGRLQARGSRIKGVHIAELLAAQEVLP